MFSEWPRLFDRNFVIGFFIPASLFLFWLWMILGAFSITPPLALIVDSVFSATEVKATAAGTASPQKPLELTEDSKALLVLALSLVVAWLLSITLLALNGAIVRHLEGYPLKRLLDFVARLWPAGGRHLRRYGLRRYRRQAEGPFRLQRRIEQAFEDERRPPQISADHADRLWRATRSFPDQRQYVLPTRFGNLYRAFEVYPRVLYHLDAIPMWPRLQSVLPEHYRKLVAEAKAQLDFCVNLHASGFILSLVYLLLSAAHWSMPKPWIMLICVLTMIFAYWLALEAVGSFGEYVKAAFDLYRGDLARQLGLEQPLSTARERQMWQTVSSMMIFRSAERASELDPFRVKVSSARREARTNDTDEV